MRETRLASLGARFAAALVDGVVSGLLTVVSGAATAFLFSSAGEEVLGLSVLSVYLLVPLVYYWAPTALSGQTLGKRLVGIKVVDAEGRPPGYFRAAMRELVGKFLSALLLYLGHLVAFFHPERRALHDLVGGTWVVTTAQEQKAPVEDGRT